MYTINLKSYNNIITYETINCNKIIQHNIFIELKPSFMAEEVC
jgi:hypothetical protein